MKQEDTKCKVKSIFFRVSAPILTPPPQHHALPPALRCESLIGSTITYVDVLLLPLLFIFSFESKPLLFLSHSVLFLPLALSFIPPSLFLMVCHCANEEEQEEKGEMNLGHRRPCISSLHSATIKRKLICGLLALLFPLALSRSRWMDGWMDGRTHNRVGPKKPVSPPPGPSIHQTKQQVCPRRGSRPCTVPFLQSFVNFKTLPKCFKIQLRTSSLHQLTVS